MVARVPTLHYKMATAAAKSQIKCKRAPELGSSVGKAFPTLQSGNHTQWIHGGIP